MGRWLAAPALLAAACLAAPSDPVGVVPPVPDAGRGADAGPVEPVDPGPVTIRSIGPTGEPIAGGEVAVSPDGLRLSVSPGLAAELVPGVMVEIEGERAAVRAIGSVELLLETPVSAGGSASFWHAYDSLPAWKNDRGRDLGAEGVSEVAAVAADLTLSGLFTIDNFATDPDHRVIIRAADGRGHRGVAGTGVTISAQPSACLRTEVDHVTVEGLEFRGCGSSSGHAAVKSLAAGDVVVDRVLVHDYRAAEAVSALSATDGGQLVVRNSIVHGGAIGVSASRTSSVLVENCTFFDLDGPAVDLITATVRNTIMIQTDGTLVAADQDHNVADFALPYGGTATAAELFVAPTASPPDLHLAPGASAALGAGADLRPAFDHDVDSQLRGGVWDVGADQQTPPP